MKETLQLCRPSAFRINEFVECFDDVAHLPLHLSPIFAALCENKDGRNRNDGGGPFSPSLMCHFDLTSPLVDWWPGGIFPGAHAIYLSHSVLRIHLENFSEAFFRFWKLANLEIHDIHVQIGIGLLL